MRHKSGNKELLSISYLSLWIKATSILQIKLMAASGTNNCSLTIPNLTNRSHKIPSKMGNARKSSRINKNPSRPFLKSALRGIHCYMAPFSARIKYATYKNLTQTRKTWTLNKPMLESAQIQIAMRAWYRLKLSTRDPSPK